jgi:hypothetical protein
MKKRVFSSVLIAFVVTGSARALNEVGFIERFALAPDRAAVLSQLVPGSEDYYFFHALHFQNSGQKERLKAIIEQWKARFPDSPRRTIIENREALLAYDADPQTTLRFLRDKLRLDLNHQQQARDQKPDLPVVLDPARVSRDAFRAEALRDSEDLAHVSDAALESLIREKAPLTRGQRRALLSRIERPDVAGLLEIIEADLKTEESKGFGEFPIHRALLPDQLDALAQRLPALYDSQAFVFARIRKMWPGPEADPEFDSAAREAYLDTVWGYVKNLSAAFNTLKAHVLYARLVHDRAKGVFERARFLEYLKLPRRLEYMRPQYLDRAPLAQHPVDVNANLVEVIVAAHPIGNDEWLVREFLIEILKDEPAWEPWAVYLRDAYVKEVFAESKILHGIGDPEKWAALISPGAFQNLKQRVELAFAPASPQFIPPADEVTIEVRVKNAPKLIVKVYELNALSFFLTQNRQLNTDINLDGLVANDEKTHDFSAEPNGNNPFRRLPRKFTFPEMKGRRGAWIVEFIGGGKSSRALIRKGQWHLVQETGPAGDMFSVIDEAQQPVPEAVLWLEGRRFTRDEKSGRILVPFTNQPGTKPAIIADAPGQFATLTNIEHHAETYALDAQFHVEREQLIPGKTATIAVRAGLVLNDSTIAPSLLLEPRLTITSTTLDNVSTTRDVTDVKLDPAKTFTTTINVPARLATLTVALSGKVEKLSAGGEKQDLSASQSWPVNGIDATNATYDGHFTRFADGHVFELLGKNGEPVPDMQVVFAFTHRAFKRPLEIPLRTDDRGRIGLGTLDEIEAFTATLPDQAKRIWNLPRDYAAIAQTIHAQAGEVIQVPWFGPAQVRRDDVSLLEMRGETFVADHFGAFSLGNGYLQISKLPPGDFSLWMISQNKRVEIRVSPGKRALRWLASDVRQLELRNPAPLQVSDARVDDAALIVQVANVNPFTRVHVSATRFINRWTLGELADFRRFEPATILPAKRPNLYVAGRAIGDEFRYILDRRYAQKFPGNMLTRPGLLLNPWEVRSTDLEAQTLAQSEALGRARGDREAAKEKKAAQQPPADSAVRRDEPHPRDENLDFLATAGPAIYNLVPDAMGIVRVDRKLLGDRQHIHVYAEDLHSAVYRSFALPELQTKFQDLRLTRNLDPQKDFTERKEITIVPASKTLTVNDLLTAEFESYDTLASVHALLTTLSGDERLAKFAWVLQWPKLSAEERRANYSEFACHELNVFLWKKDPEFFRTVIQPYLRNKKEKTFIDDFLLDLPVPGVAPQPSALRQYLEPWRFARLNMAERAFLAQRLGAPEAAATARHLRELLELIPPNPARDDLWFDTALRGRALSEPSEFAGAKVVAETVAMVPALQPAAPAAPAPAAAGLAGNRPMRGVDAADFGAQKLDESDHLAVFADGVAGKDVRYAGRMDADVKQLNTYAFAIQNTLAKEVRLQVRQFFRALGPTKEWAENNYYKLRMTQQTAELIPINAFWRDYAAWDGSVPFLSEHIAEVTRSFSEMMLALAVLDLPFEAGKHVTKSENGQFAITAATPLIAFHKEIKPVTPRAVAAAANAGSELLITENFFRENDRHRIEGNEKFDKYVTDEFLAGVVYGANVVVTNPSSSPQKVELLVQIPRGALPVRGSKATESKRLQIEPFTTKTIEYYFYFPAPNGPNEPMFAHYPVHIVRAEQTLGAAKQFSFKVVKQLSKIDTTSWEYVSQYASEGEVFAYLEKANLDRINLELVAWRARRNADFFKKLVTLLEQRHVWSEPIYRYAVVHNVAGALREWLRQRDDFIAQCGAWLATKLLVIDPIERRAYEQLEYSPLVNQRAHQLGGESRIANPVFREHYQKLLWILAYKPQLDPIDQMSVVYYLFLQDRVEEALARFDAVDPQTLPTHLQHDYFRCYAAFYREKLDQARTVAAQYAQYPVERWRKLFADVVVQLNEITGVPATLPKVPDQDGGLTKAPAADRETQQGTLTAREPSFDLKVENRTVALTWRNLSEVTINYYLMDPEFLFSSSPFVTEDPGRFSIIKPSKSVTQKLPEGKDALELALPPEFQRANVLVEVLGAGQRKAQAYHANSLKVAVTENYGRLEVREQNESRPIPKAYVKVYARLNNGTVRYFKDGYTDLRGRFDYASLNSSDKPAPPQPVPQSRRAAGADEGIDHAMLAPDELGQVEKLAILVLSESNGALVKEVSPPGQ